MASRRLALIIRSKGQKLGLGLELELGLGWVRGVNLYHNTMNIHCIYDIC